MITDSPMSYWQFCKFEARVDINFDECKRCKVQKNGNFQLLHSAWLIWWKRNQIYRPVWKKHQCWFYYYVTILFHSQTFTWLKSTTSMKLTIPWISFYGKEKFLRENFCSSWIPNNLLGISVLFSWQIKHIFKGHKLITPSNIFTFWEAKFSTGCGRD